MRTCSVLLSNLQLKKFPVFCPSGAIFGHFLTSPRCTPTSHSILRQLIAAFLLNFRTAVVCRLRSLASSHDSLATRERNIPFDTASAAVGIPLDALISLAWTHRLQSLLVANSNLRPISFSALRDRWISSWTFAVFPSVVQLSVFDVKMSPLQEKFA